MTIDLHMHSTASDGTLSPTELMRFAAECGCNTVALTDHDTAAGVSEARSEAHRLGIRFIAGIEVSSLWGGRSIHVVGLGIDDTNPVLTRKVRLKKNLRPSESPECLKRQRPLRKTN